MADLRRLNEEDVRVGSNSGVSAFVLWGGNAVVMASGRRSSVWGVAQDRELLGDSHNGFVAATGRADNACLLEILQVREVNYSEPLPPIRQAPDSTQV